MNQKEMQETHIRGEHNKKRVTEFCYNNDIDLGFVTPYHIRLSKDGKPTVDVFPRRCTAFNLDTKEWKYHNSYSDLEKYLTEQYL